MGNYQMSSGMAEKKEKFWKMYFGRLKDDKGGEYLYTPRDTLVSNMLCILVGFCILLLFFFPWGRVIFKWMGYLLGITVSVGFLSMGIVDLVSFIRHYQKFKKKYETGELEEDFTMYPYEVEPKKESVIQAEAPKVPVFFARDALKELANPLYGHFLGYQTGDFKFKNKYLFLKENEVPVTFSTEIVAIRNKEEETFVGYADFLSRFMRIVHIEDNDFLPKVQSEMGNYIRDEVKPDYPETCMVTSNYDLKILSASREIKVLTVEELKSRA